MSALRLTGGAKSPQKRKVKRVLVMVEHEEGVMSDVYDLTSLVQEMADRPDAKHQHARIRLSVDASADYSKKRGEEWGRYELESHVCWDGMFDFTSTGESGFLEDVINAGIQDSERVKRLRSAHARARTKLEKLTEEIKQQRLDDAAQIRSQHPIARVRLAPELITQEVRS